jgi:uncharacterized repeat protein (TIGR01451 family)
LLVVAPAARAAPPSPPSLVVESPTGPVAPGQTLVYKVHVANPSPSTPSAAMLLTANIPRYVAVNRPPTGRCVPKRCDGNYVARFGGTVEWKIPALPAGASTIRELRAVVDNSAEFPPPPSGALISLEVALEAGTGKAGAEKLAEATDGVRVQPTPSVTELAISGATRGMPGKEVEYEFHYGNASPAAAAMTLRVPVPPRTNVVLASRGAVKKGDTVEWDLGLVPAGYSDFRSLRLVLEGTTGAGTFVGMKAELLSPAQRATTVANHTTLVGKAPTLELAVEAQPALAVPGGTLLYKIDVTNRSPTTPTGAFVLEADIPRGAKVNRPQGGSCSPQRCDGSYTAGYGGKVSWKLKSLAPGATTAVAFTAAIDKLTDAAPPPNGTLIATELMAPVDGVIRTEVIVPVGAPPSKGRGAPLVALETPKLELAKKAK